MKELINFNINIDDKISDFSEIWIGRLINLQKWFQTKKENF